MRDVFIIGAGASGLMAAQRAASLGARVTVYEALSVPGKKLSATGNGKCNYTNMHMSPEAYHLASDVDGVSQVHTQAGVNVEISKSDMSNVGILNIAASRDELNDFYRCFERFGNTDTIDFFREIGIEPLVRDGYVYPRSGQASSVVRALVRRCEKLGVQIIRDRRIESIKELGIQNLGTDETLILACGSKASVKNCNSYRLLEELGISYSWISPALCGIYCRDDEDFFNAAAGVRCTGSINGEVGELQFTEYGISGIAAFNISHDVGRRLHAWICQNGKAGSEGGRSEENIYVDNNGKSGSGSDTSNKITLTVDFLPEYRDEDEVLGFLTERMDRLCSDASISQLKELGDGFINLKLWCALIDRTARQHGGMVTLQELAHSLKSSTFMPYKTAGFDKSQVCAGGIGTDEIDPDTMELYRHPGIYVAGELIDMDGICGGYNLQWAWTSGYIAGTYAAGGMLSS